MQKPQLFRSRWGFLIKNKLKQMVHQESYIGEAINSIQESRRAFNNLTLLATIEYGDSFWLNDEFQQSDIAAMMEKYGADIHYSLHQLNSFVSLN